MANPNRHFHIEDPTTIAALVGAHPLATLVFPHEGQMVVNHIPLWLEPGLGAQGTLWGHVARSNTVWRQLPAESAVAVFHGPQAYVSPGWYPSKMPEGKAVPTWNYTAVHAHGTLRTVTDPAAVRALVQRLTDNHEGHRAPPWTMDDAPPAFIDALLAGIVGIEFTVQRWEAIHKASQNRSAEDQAGVVRGLQAEATPHAQAMAEAMERGLPGR